MPGELPLRNNAKTSCAAAACLSFATFFREVIWCVRISAFQAFWAHPDIYHVIFRLYCVRHYSHDSRGVENTVVCTQRTQTPGSTLAVLLINHSSHVSYRWLAGPGYVMDCIYHQPQLHRRSAHWSRIQMIGSAGCWKDSDYFGLIDSMLNFGFSRLLWRMSSYLLARTWDAKFAYVGQDCTRKDPSRSVSKLWRHSILTQFERCVKVIQDDICKGYKHCSCEKGIHLDGRMNNFNIRRIHWFTQYLFDHPG